MRLDPHAGQRPVVNKSQALSAFRLPIAALWHRQLHGPRVDGLGGGR